MAQIIQVYDCFHKFTEILLTNTYFKVGTITMLIKLYGMAGRLVKEGGKGGCATF